MNRREFLAAAPGAAAGGTAVSVAKANIVDLPIPQGKIRCRILLFLVPQNDDRAVLLLDRIQIAQFCRFSWNAEWTAFLTRVGCFLSDHDVADDIKEFLHGAFRELLASRKMEKDVAIDADYWAYICNLEQNRKRLKLPLFRQGHEPPD